ncbi:hypothetical protein UMM65_02805 [Aureibaculum sp. 2210JD6-5]|uniref:hypothetical protein n=1 Tax=Aureibaculum sp. 2210JD6-5 TaxID=3103957 RepID=UPI002AAD4E60|nr:hypothetical protein [Aureibaculum sp. 2210JD6-5]MDY7394156.1 hypothetical protein [Aureibaculum sp. 2210JD6-5]
MKRFVIIFIIAIGTLLSCRKDKTDIAIKDVQLPMPQNSMQPFLFANGDELLLSWTEKIDDSLASIHYAEFSDKKWSVPIKVAEEYNLFVNWADFPAIAKNNENILLHYLQKSAPSTYAYDVRLLVSSTNGNTFNTNFLLHDDNTKTEHGFVTMLPYKDNFFVTWLDGRNTGGGGHDEGHKSNGAMNIRAATVLSTGNVIDDVLLDAKTCECCQTSAAITSKGPIVVYRDRTDDEVRDISISRFIDGSWTIPKSIHKDNWVIKGCPVNGPKAAAVDSTLAVAWFTAADNNPKVNLIFSDDGGSSFNTPIQIDNGKPIGRVDVALLDENNALLSWMESTRKEAELKIIKVNKDGTKSKSITIAELSASRASGFPQIELVNGTVYVAWNSVVGDNTSIKMKSVDATIFN